eukprot:TRINITY_DN10324_c0_g1_i1.p1 TRINITY_DN10324_c0_g1~~TRINITY_DN10324_c0_g1_i1.p1  ORF type:complete len:652 (+),score=107.70 TRINITY_DN10324_c0_g1_i1:201-2156(+)
MKKVYQALGSIAAFSQGKKNISSAHPIFGIPLHEVAKRSDSVDSVPIVVNDCLHFIEFQGGLETEGIFRISGSTNEINELKREYNQGNGTASLQQCNNVHSISGLLKLFLRELPDCALLGSNYDALVEAAGFHDVNALKVYKQIIDALPKENAVLLRTLIKFLTRVVAKEGLNKMSSTNLAIVFGPTLVRQSAEQENLIQMASDNNLLLRVVQTLINRCEDIFGPDFANESNSEHSDKVSRSKSHDEGSSRSSFEGLRRAKSEGFALSAGATSQTSQRPASPGDASPTRSTLPSYSPPPTEKEKNRFLQLVHKSVLMLFGDSKPVTETFEVPQPGGVTHNATNAPVSPTKSHRARSHSHATATAKNEAEIDAGASAGRSKSAPRERPSETLSQPHRSKSEHASVVENADSRKILTRSKSEGNSVRSVTSRRTKDFLEIALANLEESRRVHGRPSDLSAMNAAQLKQEKDAIKRELKLIDVQFQKANGYPPEKSDKEPLRVLYTRYRELKYYLEQPEEQDSNGDYEVTAVFQDTRKRAHSTEAPDSTKSYRRGSDAMEVDSPNHSNLKSVGQTRSSKPTKSHSQDGDSDYQFKLLKNEKRRLQVLLHDYQQSFVSENRRPVQTKEDRAPVQKQYERYRELKILLQQFQQQDR